MDNFIEKIEHLVEKYAQLVDLNKISTCPSFRRREKDCVKCFRHQYLNKNAIIDYNCINKRQLYIARYLPVHLKEIELGLKGLITENIKQSLLLLPKVNVISIGGGPGIDLLALKKYFLETEKEYHLTKTSYFNLMRWEKISQWDDMANELINVVKSSTYFQFKHQKLHGDITNKILWHHVEEKSIHIYLLSYVLSELTTEQIEPLKQFIESRANQTVSVVLINDVKNHSLVNPLWNEMRFSNEQCWCGVRYSVQARNKVFPKQQTGSERYFKVLSFRNFLNLCSNG